MPSNTETGRADQCGIRSRKPFLTDVVSAAAINTAGAKMIPIWGEIINLAIPAKSVGSVVTISFAKNIPTKMIAPQA